MDLLQAVVIIYQLFGISLVSAAIDSIPDDYVTTWTAWSGWSTCGATCGSSFSRRYRECVGQKNHLVFRVKTEQCPGIYQLYKGCETKPCVQEPAQPRDQQCSLKIKHTAVPEHFRGKRWHPYIVDAYPCELFCQPDGFNNFWSFGNASDGSSCRTLKAKTGVCAKGRCLEIGCDGKALSDARLDMCLVCNGRNRSCSHIKDEFREVKPPGQLGYSDVVRIPKGATNINIMDSKNILATQLYVHENVLALQDTKHFYLLNSFRWYGYNGPLRLAGTNVKFYFSRDGEKSVHILGPLKETLLVMVLQTNPYVHIKYGYWLSENAAEAPKPLRTAEESFISSPAPKAAPYKIRTVNQQLEAEVIIKQQGSKVDAKVNEVTSKEKKRRRRQRVRLSKGKKCLRKSKVNGKDLEFKSKFSKLKFIYCQSEFVGSVNILNKQRYRGETRYEIQIKNTFRNTMSMARREYVWKDRSCPGIKLKPGKDYFIMMKTKTYMKKRLTRFLIDEDSFVKKLNVRSAKLLRAAVTGVQCNS